jgi:SAM-dependent methyltransferase
MLDQTMRFLRQLRFGERPPKLKIPPEFNRNSSTVTSLMSPEQSGSLLLERMRRRLGLETYSDKKVLDFGCGVRFTQAIINTDLPFGQYVGVDVYREMIEFLQSRVRDSRFKFVFLNAHHPLYNPGGITLSPDAQLPIETKDFDVVCMFSVLTHQYPNDSRSILSILRRHVAAVGHLFFTCFLDDSIPAFEDRSDDRNGGRCFYNPAYLMELVESCGWQFVDRASGEGPLIADSFVLSPVPD